MTSSLQCRAAGKSGERILFSWIWIPYLLLGIDNVYIQNVGSLVGLLHGCSSFNVCAAILTSSSTLTLHLFTFSSFSHLFELFHPLTFLRFHPFFTILTSSSPLTVQLFILFSPFEAFQPLTFHLLAFFHLFHLFQPSYSTAFHPLFTFLTFSSPLTLRLFILFNLFWSSSAFNFSPILPSFIILTSSRPLLYSFSYFFTFLTSSSPLTPQLFILFSLFSPF